MYKRLIGAVVVLSAFAFLTVNADRKMTTEEIIQAVMAGEEIPFPDDHVLRQIGNLLEVRPGVFTRVSGFATDSCHAQFPGDANGDSTLSQGDFIFLRNYLNCEGPPPSPLANGDPNGDCIIDQFDPDYIIAFLFQSGPAPVDCTCENPLGPDCTGCDFGPAADDNTTSLGAFRILVDSIYRPLMKGCPGYDSATGKLTSPVLYDPQTVIGRSTFFSDGDADDVGGIAVGTAGTIVADSDFKIVPTGFEGPPGTNEVHTEVRSLNMTDFGGSGMAVRAGTNAPGQPFSPGEIESLDTTGDSAICFPAQSFFNIYVEVDVPSCGDLPFPGAVLYNMDPLLVKNDSIFKFPPKVVYIHDNAEAVKVYFRNSGPNWTIDDKFGWLILAGHGVDFDTVTTPAGAPAIDDVTEFMNVFNSLQETCCLLAGDADGGGGVNIGDATFLVKFIFQNGAAPVCKDQADADGSNGINIGDATYIVKFVFQNGAAPKCGTRKM